LHLADRLPAESSAVVDHAAIEGRDGLADTFDTQSA
jgi:hypothetical protein